MELIAEFEIEGLPEMTNKIGRKHWSVKFKEARKWKGLVVHACAEAHITNQNLSSAVLTLTRHSSVEPDFDGLVSGFKHVIDGLVLAGVIVDDKASVIQGSQYAWKYRARKLGGKITVRIEAKEGVSDVA